jgi:glycosyltransferase involved in cell wall biosynthesis
MNVRPSVSLCTYTYNDGAFVPGLLESAAAWSVRPDEIVIVDDGSEPAFAFDRLPDSARIVRLDPNRGFAAAKGTGLSAARGDLLFSLDCDMRPDPDWLAICLAHARDPSVGLVGGAVTYGSGRDVVSRWLALFGDNHNLSVIGPVEFIPGNAFLLRRAVFEAVGGFSGFGEPVCEDHELCRRIRQQGLTLYSDARARAVQIRRLHRTVLCRRIWLWCHKPVKARLPGRDLVAPYLFEVLARPMLERIETAVERGEPLFLYLELLYLAHAVLDVLAFAASRGLVSEAARAGFAARLWAMLAGRPRVAAFLAADLARIGHDLAPSLPADAAAWDDFFLFADLFAQGGLLAWLEAEGLSLLAREDMEEEFDFSTYGTKRFEVG